MMLMACQHETAPQIGDADDTDDFTVDPTCVALARACSGKAPAVASMLAFYEMGALYQVLPRCGDSWSVAAQCQAFRAFGPRTWDRAYAGASPLSARNRSEGVWHPRFDPATWDKQPRPQPQCADGTPKPRSTAWTEGTLLLLEAFALFSCTEPSALPAVRLARCSPANPLDVGRPNARQTTAVDAVLASLGASSSTPREIVPDMVKLTVDSFREPPLGLSSEDAIHVWYDWVQEASLGVYIESYPRAIASNILLHGRLSASDYVLVDTYREIINRLPAWGIWLGANGDVRSPMRRQDDGALLPRVQRLQPLMVLSSAQLVRVLDGVLDVERIVPWLACGVVDDALAAHLSSAPIEGRMRRLLDHLVGQCGSERTLAFSAVFAGWLCMVPLSEHRVAVLMDMCVPILE